MNSFCGRSFSNVDNSNIIGMTPTKAQMEKFRKIDKYKKEQRKKRRMSSLDVIGTKEKRDEWIGRFKEYFYEKADNAYHYFIYERYEEPFLIACEKLELKISGFTCKCVTENDRPHLHYIVWISNPRNVKQPSTILSHKLKEVMTHMKISKSAEDKRCLYGKKINNRAHLINTLLYIMTVNTKGRHGRKLVDCQHSGRCTVIPDRETRHNFQIEEVDVAIPKYSEERKNLWQQHKKDNNMEVNEEYDPADVIKKRISDF